MTPEHVAKHTKALQEWWDISSREDLIRNLDWLSREGHRREFEEIGRSIYLLDSSQITTFQGYLRGTPDIFKKTAIARAHLPQVWGQKPEGLGFPAGTSICAGPGMLAGISRKMRPGTRIMPVARLLQRTFTSWSDLAMNYQTGRWFLEAPPDPGRAQCGQHGLHRNCMALSGKQPPGTRRYRKSLTVRMLRPFVNWLGRSFGDKKGS